MSTTKFNLYFISNKGDSFITVTTKAQGRNSLGLMTYESRSDCFKRACGLIDFNKYTFTEAKAYANAV